jgi:hypothetical protein
MRQYLPDSAKATTNSAADSTYRQEIRVGPDSARVEMEWTSFQHNSARLLSTISARLLAPVHYDSLRLGTISDLHNAGTKFNPIESANIQVIWFKRKPFGNSVGVVTFTFDAAGVRTVRAPAAE